MKSAPKVVVIGAGFGGLAAAIRLQARGFAVTLVDKRDAAGGRAYVYRDEGFAFDGGPTVVTAPFLIEELFALAGKRMEEHLTLMPVDPFYRIRFADGRLFDYTGDAERMAAEVRKFSPGDVDGYARFVEESQKIFAVGFEQLGDVPFSRARDMLKIVPQMIRLRSHLSVWRLVCKYIKDDALRVVMSFHPLLVGGNPFTTTSIYTLIAYLERKWGVWFAKGGTGAIVQALVELFVSLGGVLELGAAAEEIIVDGGRASGVRLAGGRTLPATIVVSNGDAPATYKRLLPASARRKHSDDKVDRMRYSMSLFVSYFGTKKQYSDLAHHTILLGPRYRELLTDIFDRKRLATDFSLYLHAPTRTDPSLAPPGCENFYVLSPVPHLESGDDWSKRGAEYQQTIFESLERTVIPGLRDNLVTSRFITPDTFAGELASEKGAAFSIQPVLMQSAYFRFHNKSEDVDGLYLVGAGTHPGAGLPGVLSSAKVVDRLIADVDGTGNTRDPIAGTHAG
ncbi:MAG: phytoene desaturase [Myxococcales bacterium]|nr:phytoene desaturase [Myxococcales bacterium]